MVRQIDMSEARQLDRQTGVKLDGQIVRKIDIVNLDRYCDAIQLDSQTDRQSEAKYLDSQTE